MPEEHNCRNYHCELTHVNPQTFKPHSAILVLPRSFESVCEGQLVLPTTHASTADTCTNPGVTTFHSSIRD